MYVHNDPVNWVDPWGLITRYYRDPNAKTRDEIIKDADQYIDYPDKKYGDIWDAMEEARKASEPLPEREEGCLEKCLLNALLGDPRHGYNGAGATYLEEKVGDYALRLAKKKMMKTVTVRIGAYAIPGLGTISSALTLKDFIDCIEKNCCLDK